MLNKRFKKADKKDLVKTINEAIKLATISENDNISRLSRQAVVPSTDKDEAQPTVSKFESPGKTRTMFNCEQQNDEYVTPQLKITPS